MRVLWSVSALCLALLVFAGCATQPAVQEALSGNRNILFTVQLTETSPSLASSFTAASHQIITAPSNGVSLELVIGAVIKSHSLKHMSQFPLRSLDSVAVVAEIATDANVTSVIKALSEDQRVHTVQSVKPYKLMSYNDPYFALQNIVSGERIERVHQRFTGKNVVVGIVDTGVDRRHPELAGSIIYTSNSVAHDQQSFDRDEHGTAVAGVIGSAANNDLGIVGVAPEAGLMVFKACHQEVSSRRTSCDSVSIVKALNDVLVQMPDVLNLSLSGPKDDLIAKLLRQAVQRGIVVVAAVDESLSLEGSFPANMPEVIAVGTTIGASRNSGSMVLAPGTDMLTTTPGATYGFKSGSSMATAYVSGIIALMIDREPGLSRDEIFLRLKQSTRLSENRMPFVDLCLAINFGVGSADQICEYTPQLTVHAALTKPLP
ncbi:MAG: hypothetical protein ACI8Z1_001004 [Candidatus Azotimanducaceae bacterium]